VVTEENKTGPWTDMSARIGVYRQEDTSPSTTLVMDLKATSVETLIRTKTSGVLLKILKSNGVGVNHSKNHQENIAEN
jgi:hypothetical protein